jgi:hypothetical protein
MFRPLRLARHLLLVAMLQLAACASTPQAGPERDAEAKEVHAHPATAALFVYRPDAFSLDEETVLYIDHRLIGATLPRTFFRIDVRPGKHRLHGIGPDSGGVEVDVRPGQVYFVSLKVFGGNSYFALEDSVAGRQDILGCCALLENWSPGQRPLLR